MIAKNLITDEIPALKTTDTGAKALQWMEEFKVTHLPVVKGRELVGLISENDIFDLNNPDQELGTVSFSPVHPFVSENVHVYEVIKYMSMMGLSVIPVLDSENNYIGLISHDQIIHFISSIASIKDPGGIIVLQVNERDYSLTEIANIVEGNDGKILSMYITSHPESTELEITIKVNRTELSSILQTFNRYEYLVKASFSESTYNEDMQSRFDSFMKHFNM